MRNNDEYILCKQVAAYLRAQYPKVIFHFDLAGLNLSRAQAGMMKAIQGGRGFPDLFIAQPKLASAGLFLELKKEGTKLFKLNGDYVSEHIAEQAMTIANLKAMGYTAWFAIGLDDAMKKINTYLCQEKHNQQK